MTLICDVIFLWEKGFSPVSVIICCFSRQFRKLDIDDNGVAIITDAETEETNDEPLCFMWRLQFLLKAFSYLRIF